MKKFLKTLLFTTMLIVFMTGCSDLSSNTNNSGIPSIPGGGGSDTSGDGSDTGDNGQGGGDDTISAPAGTGGSSEEIYGNDLKNLYGAGGVMDNFGKLSNPSKDVDPETGRGGFINNIVTPSLNAGDIIQESENWVIYADGTAVDKKRNLVLGLAYIDTLEEEAYTYVAIADYDPVADFTKPDNLYFTIENNQLKIKGDLNYKQNHTVFKYISEELQTEQEIIVPLEFELLIINPVNQPIEEIIFADYRPYEIPDEYLERQFDNVDCFGNREHFLCHNPTERIDLNYNKPVSKRVSKEQFVYKTFNNYKQYFSQKFADKMHYGIPNTDAIEGFLPASGYWGKYGKNIFRQYQAINLDFKEYLEEYPDAVIPEQTIYTGKFMYKALDGSIDNIPVEIILTYK
ncbi:MAG: hypothetical protein ROM03_06515 [Mucispirillum sp.]|nr:hypothetical protein [Mucispirillum sp.]